MRIRRSAILEALREEIAEGRPILGAGCSAGIIAKSAEAGGADLIIVYSTGRSRMMGLPTTMITVTSNATTLAMFDEIDNVVEKAPIIAGVEANDIFCLDLRASLERFLDKGFSGVINFPTTGLYENLIAGGMALRRFTEAMAAGYRTRHWGWSREVEMIRMLHEWDVFTMCYVFTASDALEMVEAGVDAICVHVGPTMGGMAGQPVVEDTEQLLARAQEVMTAARGARCPLPGPRRPLLRSGEHEGGLRADRCGRIRGRIRHRANPRGEGRRHGLCRLQEASHAEAADSSSLRRGAVDVEPSIQSDPDRRSRDRRPLREVRHDRDPVRRGRLRDGRADRVLQGFAEAGTSPHRVDLLQP
jgi:predicted TIM-barrel enzyme